MYSPPGQFLGLINPLLGGYGFQGQGGLQWAMPATSRSVERFDTR